MLIQLSPFERQMHVNEILVSMDHKLMVKIKKKNQLSLIK